MRWTHELRKIHQLESRCPALCGTQKAPFKKRPNRWSFASPRCASIEEFQKPRGTFLWVRYGHCSCMARHGCHGGTWRSIPGLVIKWFIAAMKFGHVEREQHNRILRGLLKSSKYVPNEAHAKGRMLYQQRGSQDSFENLGVHPHFSWHKKRPPVITKCQVPPS